MQLPGPVRAAVGLLATAADEAKHLPDRAIELPMLAVSTALQVSLRAQQRYAKLAARGDEALSRSKPSDEPPPWATFDDPLSADDLRAARDRTDARSSRPAVPDATDGTGELIEQIFGTDEPQPPSQAVPPATTTPATTTPATTTPARKAARKTTAKKSAVKRAAAKKTATNRAAAKTATESADDSPAPGKSIRPPRHTTPSRFDVVADQPATDDGDDLSRGSDD